MIKIKEYIKENKVTIGLLAIIVLLMHSFTLNFAIMFVSGNSMHPTYSNNDILVIKRDKEIQKDALVVFNPSETWTKGLGPKFIKRIYGTPGDKIVINYPEISVNGKTRNVSSKQCLKEKRERKEIILGKNEYFVMGDNTSSSNDSLFQYCENNNEILVNKKDIVVYGQEYFVIGGFN